MVAVSVWLLSGGNTWAAPFTSLYSFGDSLSDAGDSPSAVTSLYRIWEATATPRTFAHLILTDISNGPVPWSSLRASFFREV